MRADRLVALVLLLQARGRVTAATIAGELGVSVRTVYRDLTALSAAGVPVVTGAGPGGGCELLAGYRFPLRGLSPEEAEALLILGVPGALRDLGLAGATTAAHRQIRRTVGLAGQAGGDTALVHLDMPGWFRSQEQVPWLRTVAQALRQRRRLALAYARGEGHPARRRTAGPLGLVNKAGTWYLVAAGGGGRVMVFRVGRITAAEILAEPCDRPADFELAGFWEQWSAEFAASRPRLPVRLRASPQALASFPEIFGESVNGALAAAGPPDEQGWQVVTLSFEHELAAACRLAGFGGQVEVLAPLPVRERLLDTARGILGRYGDAVTPPGTPRRPAPG